MAIPKCSQIPREKNTQFDLRDFPSGNEMRLTPALLLQQENDSVRKKRVLQQPEATFIGSFSTYREVTQRRRNFAGCVLLLLLLLLHLGSPAVAKKGEFQV